MAVGASQDTREENTREENNVLVTVKIGGKDLPLAEAEAFCRRHANGFFYISGLSLINMIAIAGGLNFAMYLGLGATQVMQVFAMVADDPAVMVGCYVAGLAVIALFGVLGWRARQIERWPFVLGMSLYAADSLIFLIYQDYWAFGFHVFWLLFLGVGKTAVAPIQAARQHLSAPSRPDDVPEEEKLPGFLRAGPPSATATSPAASSSS